MQLILASQSPRRRELMQLMGLDFVCEPSREEERPPKGVDTAALVKALALAKAEDVFSRHPAACVIGADTVVELDGEVLGKPHTIERAKDYLGRLQGRMHEVYTGLCVLTPEKRQLTHCVTRVFFRPMSEGEIDWYVGTGDPLDKAGSYGVQGPACVYVERIEGNYFNVIGLPVPQLYALLKNAGALPKERL